MLQHSFVLDALETTGADTFSHFEILVEEHRRLGEHSAQPSRLKQLVPTIGLFQTTFLKYNEKHKLMKRKHIQNSFNEIRHILNLAQIMALRSTTPLDDKPEGELGSIDDISLLKSSNLEDMEEELPETNGPPGQLNGPKLISFDGDQTLYSDGANFEENPQLANYLYLLLRHGVYVAIVTAAGYECQVEKYEFRIS